MIHDTQSAPQVSQKQDDHEPVIRLSPQWLCGNLCTCAHDAGYTLLVPVNQRVLNKLSKEHNISDHKWSTTHRVLKSHGSKMSIIYMLSWKHICYYAHLTSVRFEQSVCHTLCTLWSLMSCSLTSLLRSLWFIGTSNV